jgi:hypothetical protein
MPRSAPIEPAARPDEGAVMNVIGRVVSRTRARHAIVGTTLFLVLVAAGIVARQAALGVGLGIVAGGAALWRGRGERSTAAAARRIEQASPGSRNLVITAEELFRHPDRAAPWMRARVLSDAAEPARSIRTAQVAPLRGPVVALLLAVCLVAALATAIGRTSSRALLTTVANAGNVVQVAASAPLQIDVTVTPPAYSGKPVYEARNPERIEAIQGSSLRISVSGPGAAWRVRSAAGALPSRESPGKTVVETRVSESGYFAIEPTQDAAAPRARRLIPLVMIPDRAPTVRVEIPGRDLIVQDGKASVAVEASASDDFGVHALEIRYTKVSGAGEQFEFEEGTLPLTVTRVSNASWRTRGRISLALLKLEPGDSLVYRAIARDGRPGDEGLATSETFFIEVAGPGQAALEGFEMPPAEERYALSQQMIVLKIQRLRARERRMSEDALAAAAAPIAAEQRAVRANFIFLMGGHVEDRELEAEPSHEHEIEEGRLENAARDDINAAVVHMSRAEQELGAVDTTSALDAARAAVQALQRAFGRRRYILKTIPVGSRVDPSRRLSGELPEAGDWRRDPGPSSSDRETQESRTLLLRMLQTAASLRAGRTIDPSVFVSLAEQALAIEPGAAVWQDVARRLQALADGRDSTPQHRSAQLSEAIGPALARARRAGRMPVHRGTRTLTGLEGAWATEFRR